MLIPGTIAATIKRGPKSHCPNPARVVTYLRSQVLPHPLLLHNMLRHAMQQVLLIHPQVSAPIQHNGDNLGLQRGLEPLGQRVLDYGMQKTARCGTAACRTHIAAWRIAMAPARAGAGVSCGPCGPPRSTALPPRLALCRAPRRGWTRREGAGRPLAWR